MSVDEEVNNKRDFSEMEFEGKDWINVVSFDKRGGKLCDFYRRWVIFRYARRLFLPPGLRPME
jgi:hypothetical protein